MRWCGLFVTTEPSKRGLFGTSIISRVIRLAIIFASIGVVFWITGCMERMFYHPTREATPIPADLRQAGAEAVNFQSKDGTVLLGWFVPARDGHGKTVAGLPTPTASPTILHVHGNAGNISSHFWFTEYLPDAGFNVFIFDYRGYGESEGAAHSRAPLIADTQAALDALLKRADVDPNRIGMYGQSLGGAIGLNVMADRKEIRAAVIDSTFTSWRDIAACAVGGQQPNFVCRSLATVLIPDSHRVDDAIVKVDRPILLVHGDADSIIPVIHSRNLAKAGGPNVKLIELPGGDHNSLRETHPEIEKIVIDFLRSTLTDESIR